MTTQQTTQASTTEQFKEMVRAEWTDERTVQAWTHWKDQLTVQTADATAAIIEYAALSPGQTVLDIACGTGGPALAFASAVGPSGHVTATDLSDGMLAAARVESAAHGVTNISFRQADAHSLPFADASFDRVTCRFGVMYFADAPTALGEIRRVLRPGGRASFLAWGALEANPFMLATAGPFFQRVMPPPPPPDAPTPFRYAHPGSLSAALSTAGFVAVKEETRDVLLPWPGSPEELWEHFYDVAAPFRPMIDGLPADERKAAIGEVLTALRHYYDGNRVATPGSVVVASARSPEVGTRSRAPRLQRAPTSQFTSS